jgi:pimeloyl-ACP methyl ester carboxylesterase
MPAKNADRHETVILLHGLARSPWTLGKIEHQLRDAGYSVYNISYPSRHHTIAELAAGIVKEVQEKAQDATKIHFVTHSMGGIIVRQMLADNSIPTVGRVVMLSPPNQGSEVVDRLGHWRLFKWINGPAGCQLGTDAGNVPCQLGPPPPGIEIGIITGDRSINWILSSMIPGKDDGKVSVERAKLAGMKEFRVYHSCHPLIMRKQAVIDDVKAFLESGAFKSITNQE